MSGSGISYHAMCRITGAGSLSDGLGDSPAPATCFASIWVVLLCIYCEQGGNFL